MVSIGPKNLKYLLGDKFGIKWNLPSVILLFIVLNMSIFVTYLLLTNQYPSYESFMNFLKVSNGFLIVVINIFAPIVLSVITYSAQLQEKRVEEKKQEHLDSIKQTQKMWKDLLILTSQVRYYNKEKPIEQIRLELDAFRVTIREVKNIWDLNFKNLELLQPENSEYLDLLKKPVYILYNSANTVAQLIHDNKILFEDILSLEEINQKNRCEKEKERYQFALGIIQTNINNIFHDSILNILKNYVDMEYGNKKDKEDSEKEIKIRLEYLDWHYNELSRIEINNNKVFSYLKDSENIQTCFNDIEQWVRYENNRLDTNVRPKDCYMFKKLKKMFQELPENERRYSISSPYCPECMMELSNHLDFIDVNRDIVKRAKWTDKNQSSAWDRIK